VRVREVLEQQGRWKTWFLKQMGGLSWSVFGNPNVWTREMRDQAAEILGVTVEELFPPEDEADLTPVDLAMRLDGRTQEEIAHRMGCDPSYLYLMRVGRRRWQDRWRAALAMVLGVSIDELFPEGEDGRGDDGREPGA